MAILDANNIVVILAYAMVPSKNGKKWQRLMTLLIQEAILEIADSDSIFISDREKGLLPSVCHVFPVVVHCHCTWHLGDNIKTRFGKKWVIILDTLVYAITPDQFKS